MSQDRPTHQDIKFDEPPRIAIVTAEWNARITHALRDGALDVLRRAGIPDSHIQLHTVPGAVELTYAAARLMDTLPMPEAIIVFGCVIRGDTPHFDYVCQSVTQGVTMLNARGDIPVIFGLLTVDTLQQALDRIGGPAGHKGAEAADTALSMVTLSSAL